MGIILGETNQTIYDIALKKNGNTKNVFFLMSELGIVNINEPLENRVFETKFETTNNFVKTLFMNSKNLVTGAVYSSELDITGAGFSNGFSDGFDVIA